MRKWRRRWKESEKSLESKKIKNNNIPLFTYITDIDVNEEWICENTNMYFVGSEKTKESLIQKGVEKEKIIKGISEFKLTAKRMDIEIIKNKTGYSPILLLDDVLAELDEVRQNYLLKSIEKDTQTIITSVDTILFEDEFLKDVIIYKVDGGKIVWF